MFRAQPCPCGSGRAHDACCGPLHRGEREAVTAEELMRSRYAAYALDQQSYLFRTWHPRTRPEDLRPTPGLSWTRLEIVAVRDGGVDDSEGLVEFVAHYRRDGRAGTMREGSAFTRRAGRWVYVSPAD